MFEDYSNICDDFSVEMYLNTELELPKQRDTVLTFFERIGKQFPAMGDFYHRNKGFCLEEEREDGQQFWVGLESDRVGAGVVNPADAEEACQLQRLVLELAPYMLGISRLDIGSLDVTFGMDFEYRGNHDEVIAEALFSSSAFSCMLDVPGTKAISFSPTVLFSLSEDFRTQAKITIESKTSAFENRTQKYKSDEAISLFLTVRRYPDPGDNFDMLESFQSQLQMVDELMTEKIVPNFAKPLANVITQKRLI